MMQRDVFVWICAFLIAAGLHIGLLSLIVLPREETAELAGGSVSVALGPATMQKGEADGATDFAPNEVVEPAVEPTAEPVETPATDAPVTPEPERILEPEPEPIPEVEPEPDFTPEPEPEPVNPISETETDTETTPLGDPMSKDQDDANSDTAAERSPDSAVSDGVADSELATESSNAAQAGNAAADNYAGEVMRHILRVRRPRATRAGSTFVRFEIDSEGRLVDLSIATSSGSRRFDRDALRVIERADPFPPPPAGVTRRTFTVEIEGS